MKKNSKATFAKYLLKITVVLAFMMSITVGSMTAYATNKQIEGINCFPEQAYQAYVNKDIKFVDDIDQPLEILNGHDYKIIDNGTIRNIDRVPEVRACVHGKTNVYISHHAKFITGSCTTVIYEGQQCTKCGKYWVGNEVNKIKQDKCTH